MRRTVLLMILPFLFATTGLLTPSPSKADWITHGATTINMDFVTVGNAGNAGEQSMLERGGTTYFGSVGYNYRIGKYEVTAAQWAAVRAADPNVGNTGSWYGSQPTAGTSWYEAAKFCNWLTTGNANSGVYNTSTWAIMDHQTAGTTFGTAYFIPTENEWYKAAYYDPNKSGAGVGGYWDYPTKHDSPNGPDGHDFEGDTVFDAVFWDDNLTRQGQPNRVNNAGVLSAYGTMGQGGNVFEWNETAFGSSRGVRGGAWGTDSGFLLASYRADLFSPTMQQPYLGFRVASIESTVVPAPSSLACLIGVGVLVGLNEWRKKRRTHKRK